MSSKRSHKLNQTSTIDLYVYVSTRELLVNIMHKKVNCEERKREKINYNKVLFR